MADNWREVSATWKGGLSFIGESDKGGTVQMGPTDKNIGPMQLLLVGLAGCTGIDIVSMLEKKKINPNRFQGECAWEASQYIKTAKISSTYKIFKPGEAEV